MGVVDTFGQRHIASSISAKTSHEGIKFTKSKEYTPKYKQSTYKYLFEYLELTVLTNNVAISL